MTLGLVIVTYQCRAYALRCLESVSEHLPEVLATTVVVDNASTDGTADALREQYPAIQVITNEDNRGFAPAVNQGIQALALCDAVALLNPDSVVLDGGLLQAYSYLESNPDTGIAGIRIENSDGTLQPSCRRFPNHLTALFNKHSLVTRLLPNNRWSQQYLMTDWAHDEVREVDWVAFSCAVIHRRAIDAVGLLDEEYFFSIEDVDYCRRVHDAGLKVVYFPMARVRHRVGGSSRKNVYRAMRAHHAGMWRYYKKFSRRNPALDAITAGGIGLRLGVHVVSHQVRVMLGKEKKRQAAAG